MKSTIKTHNAVLCAYRAYRGIFIIPLIVWGIVDKKKPDRYEIIGSIVAIVEAEVIIYTPR
jgi:small multidrug resistance family-3 protein